MTFPVQLETKIVLVVVTPVGNILPSYLLERVQVVGVLLWLTW